MQYRNFLLRSIAVKYYRPKNLLIIDIMLLIMR